MEILTTPPKTLIPPSFPMNKTISTTLKTKSNLFNYSKFQTCCLSSLNLSNTQELIPTKNCRKRVLGSRIGVKPKAKASDAAELKAELKKKYLDSLSSPLPEKGEEVRVEGSSKGGGVEWVIGIDPDLSGAMAVVKSDSSGYSAEVFDNPYVQVLVGKRVRKRLDTRSIVQLLQRFDAPVGTTAYIEQSIPFPQDGKQGWWSGGFGYGLWIGVLVASGFNVVPVPSLLWKNHYELSGSRTSKDDSRKAAAMLFPSLSSLMKRKKDHGRAEALLIAAYGKGLRLKPDPEPTPDPELVINRELMIIPDLCTALTC